jgi:hypothetical protein
VSATILANFCKFFRALSDETSKFRAALLEPERKLSGIKALTAAWVLKSGGPDHLPIFERCLLNGSSISCNWDHNSLAYNDVVSLELLSKLNVRSKCPTILSWWTEDDKGNILQRYGIPAFFLRLDYTSSCMDQAYACMLHIPSPDMYRK